MKERKLSFLIYDNRSGSTFLSALIDSFEDIGVSIESKILQPLLTGKETYRTESEIDHILEIIYRDPQFVDWGIPGQSLKRRLVRHLPLGKKDIIYVILETYFNRVKPNSKCWVYKNSNPYILRRIRRIIPDAKIIYIYRDGRAVFSSKKRSNDKR